MCSVIGFSGQYESFTLEKIFFNSQIRGIHAFGYAFFCDKELIVKKHFNYNDFLKSIHNEKPNKSAEPGKKRKKLFRWKKNI